MDRFRVEARIGSGTFASVWRAVDTASGKIVALKVLYDRYREDRRVMQRFAQEARLLERLCHPGIARAVAWSIEGEHAFLAMEYVAGQTLADRLNRIASEGRRIPLGGAAWFCDQMAHAVAHAHAHGVIHRDLKPTNVMVNVLGQRPFLKVLDFGIAKVFGATDVEPTTAGTVLGSMLYLPPEQFLKGLSDERSDVFAIATMLFEIVTLRRAWARGEDGLPLPCLVPLRGASGNNQLAILHRIAREERPRASSSRQDVSEEIDRVLAKGMAIEPRDRYGSPLELADAFREAIAPKRKADPEDEITLRDPLGMLETLPEVRIVRG